VTRDIWIGDVLRALRATDVADRPRVLRLLGFEAPDVPAPQAGELLDPDEDPDANDREPPGTQLILEEAPAPGVEARLRDRQPTLIADIPLLTPVRAAPAVRSASAVTGASLPRVVEERHLSPVLPYQPLFPPASTPAILQQALSRQVAEGAIDIPALVETLARRQPVAAVRRRAVPTLRYGVQVLVDLGPAMQPFRRDQAEIMKQIISVVGREKVTVKYFAYCPVRKAGPGPRWTWRPYQPPPRHTPILLLSDLGIGGPTGDFRRSTRAEWREFGRIAAGNGSEVIAFLVYPPSRWPTWLPALGRGLTWDRGATARSAQARS